MRGQIIAWIAVMVLCLPSLGGGARETLRDIRQWRQDHNVYLDALASQAPMMSAGEQERRDRDYNERHFSPWHQDRPRSGPGDIRVEFEKYGRNRGYGANGRPYGPGWIRRIERNARLRDYPAAGYPAITIRRADMRSLPTARPHFDTSAGAMSGHPFDNLQATAVMPGTPIFIAHISRDRKWVWAETGYYFGWLRVADTAALPDGFMKKWETGRYAVIVRDKTPLYDGTGRLMFRAPLGAVFPLVREDDRGVEILAAAADAGGRAVPKHVALPKDAATAKPLPMTAPHMARLANELLHEPYGWGGLRGARDCSAMIRDLFAPFGLWLPRNSGDQALKGGAFIDLSGLSAAEKRAKILSRGIPYLTLLWRRGHIMLYLGSHDGEPLVFHNLWGVSVRNASGGIDKVIVGHAAITTLHPGRERSPDPDADEAFIDLIIGMTLIGEGAGEAPPAGGSGPDRPS